MNIEFHSFSVFQHSLVLLTTLPVTLGLPLPANGSYSRLISPLPSTKLHLLFPALMLWDQLSQLHYISGQPLATTVSSIQLIRYPSLHAMCVVTPSTIRHKAVYVWCWKRPMGLCGGKAELPVQAAGSVWMWRWESCHLKSMRMWGWSLWWRGWVPGLRCPMPPLTISHSTSVFHAIFHQCS